MERRDYREKGGECFWLDGHPILSQVCSRNQTFDIPFFDKRLISPIHTCKKNR